METEDKFIAHIAEDGRTQTVEEHLKETAALAARFAAAFGAEEAGRFLGLAHDIGKYSAAFQRRIRGGPRCDHATAGALECAYRDLVWAACCVLGHHGGLRDLGNYMDGADETTVFGRLRCGAEGGIPDYRAGWPGVLPPSPVMAGWDRDRLSASFFIRMLYSCLVDADFLDTERFMAGDVGRGGYESLTVLRDRLEERTAGWWPPATELNKKRCEILAGCKEAGALPRGLYTLTVPTGGGKTVASLAFALRHAVENGMDRVIYVVPYVSIIEQTSRVFRNYLGEQNVLEHHAGSMADMDENPTPEQVRHALAAENWDAPVVVTTAVRFFEALYAGRSSKCRRLHNLANSVIIFDEAQMIPVEHLRPCVAAIAQLVKSFRATAVLCTATQPALGGLFREFLPDMPMRELCPGASAQAEAFRRVRFQFAGRMEPEALAAELAGQRQVLCVVNTRKSAQELFYMLPEEGRFHLSTRMCPTHRRAVLEEIKQRLTAKEVCRVVSTSLIEAGVDVDFPAVYRQMAGLDSILQAAGRCNREGKRPAEESVVTVFDDGTQPPELFQANVYAASQALESGREPAEPDTVERYFSKLFDLRAQAMDKYGVLDAFEKGIGGRDMPFQTVGEKFHLIDGATKTIYIPWGEGAALADRLLAGERSRALFRQAGQYSVSVYPWEIKRLEAALAYLDENTAVLADASQYDGQTGLHTEDGGGKAFII